jgi:hypothetical protein
MNELYPLSQEVLDTSDIDGWGKDFIVKNGSPSQEFRISDFHYVLRIETCLDMQKDRKDGRATMIINLSAGGLKPDKAGVLGINDGKDVVAVLCSEANERGNPISGAYVSQHY